MDMDSGDTQSDSHTETDARYPWILSLPLSPPECSSQDGSDSSSSSPLDSTSSCDDEDGVADAVSLSPNSERTSESSVPPTPDTGFSGRSTACSSPPSLSQQPSCPASPAQFPEYNMWTCKPNLHDVLLSCITKRASRSSSGLSNRSSDGTPSPFEGSPTLQMWSSVDDSFLHNTEQLYGNTARPRFRPTRRTANAESTNGGPNYCVFCRNNGEPPVLYNAHRIKDNRGRVTCPVLFAYTCPNCAAFGDNAHTIKYCPLNQTPEAQQAQAAANRHPEGQTNQPRDSHCYTSLIHVHPNSTSTVRSGRLREQRSASVSSMASAASRNYNGDAGAGDGVRGSMLMSALDHQPSFCGGQLTSSFSSVASRRRH